MKRITLVKSNRANFIPDDLDIENVTIMKMFKGLNSIQNIFREFSIHFNYKVKKNYYNPELINIDTDLIIVTDCHLQIHFLLWLKQKNPNTRIIVWYWNSVSEIGHRLHPTTIPNGIEKWSYSKHDCEKYNMKYNTTCYPYKDYVHRNDLLMDTDIYFLGKDKGRLNRLLTLKRKFEELGLSTYFHICPTNRYLLKTNKIYRPQIPYKDVLMQIIRSRAILDCYVSKTAGPTIRRMESIFYERKLITDDESIVECDFYNPQNIFVLNKDSFADLPKFIAEPYQKLDPALVDSYTMRSWFDRFYI